MVLNIINGEQRINGIQLTGRHAWPDALTNAARAYAREPNAEKQETLKSEQRKAAEGLVALQHELGFSYVTEGGFALKDDFIPYIERLKGVEGGEGQINQQPGTRNQYYFRPFVTGKLHADGEVYSDYTLTDAIPRTYKRKLILPSPLSLALASESSAYSSRINLLYDFAEVQKKEIERFSEHYDSIHLNEGFATDERFAGNVNTDLLSAFKSNLDKIFRGRSIRSAVHFYAGDARRLIPWVLDSKVTDIGFDFNTDLTRIGEHLDKNLILGLQNITRKLPENLLAEEPKRLAIRTNEVLDKLKIADGVEIFLGQSQGSDGLQTYPQAVRRDESLSKAFRILTGDIR
ncbi:MAG: hypothetical protein KGH57_03170 [Candidatus Micrarchaeota archaeon]|nr:hypothetical protein [Candidatus Micrarchaeota archaeon]